MAELGLIMGAIAATAACAAAGVALRRRTARNAAAVDWTISVGGVHLRVHGPWRNTAGVVSAMTAREQRAWAESRGARLPTAEEFDQIWATAGIKVPPHLYPGATGPLDAFNEDIKRAGGKPGDRIAGNKTWIASPPGVTTNYGYFVPKREAEQTESGWSWRGIKAYATTLPDYLVLQPPGSQHNDTHTDNSQTGYAVEEVRSA